MASELRDALSQISEIRASMARAEVFRGYRSLTALFFGVVAVAAGFWQRAWIAEPMHNLDRYLFVWWSTAVTSLTVVGAEMVFRVRRSGSALQRDTTLAAVQQFVPCLMAGILLAVVIGQFSPAEAWMLPGLWAMVIGLGVFASRPPLPRATVCVGAYYLLAGMVCLARGRHALSPWAMGGTFGIGQTLAAAVLYWTLERTHVERAAGNERADET